MTTSIDPHGTSTSPEARAASWYAKGLAHLAVVTVVSLAAWYLLVDARWSPLGIYPEPFNALLFWSILAVVWLGFTMEFQPVNRFRQPVRGLLVLLAAFVIGTVITLAFAYGYGSFDPTFAPDRADGTGFFASALWVLFGFFFYVTGVVNWAHWPFSQAKLAQPWLGLGQVAVLIVPTTILYLIIAIPGIAPWADPARALMSTNTAIGWFYSVIVAVVVTGLLTENWPWRLAGSPGRVAMGSLVGNVIIGTGIYFVFLALTKVLIGAGNVAQLGDAITIFPAQLGVCWVFWMVFWANCFGNKPDAFSPAVNYVLRIVITFVLAVGTFLLYYFVLAGPVLHEPATTSQLGGNALGWVDWWIFWTLVYVLGFQSWGLPAALAEPGAAIADTGRPAAAESAHPDGSNTSGGVAMDA